MLAVKIKRLKISKSYSPNYNFVQFPWPAIPSTVHSSQIIVHLIMNPLKSTGTCVHVLIVSLPGFSVGNTAGENPGIHHWNSQTRGHLIQNANLLSPLH